MRADALVVKAEAAGEAFDLLQMVVDGFEVGVADGAGVDADAGFAFETFEGSLVTQVKGRLGAVEQEIEELL